MILTAEQQSAVDYPHNILVTACPGSGKTKTIVSRLVKEIEELRETPRSVACLTYTNSAVQEIEHRISSFVRVEDFKNYTVATIHSFCLNNIFRPFAWKLHRFKKMPKVLTPENPDFASIADYAASRINCFNLSIYDYEAFEGLNIDIEGNIIGVANDNEIVKQSAPFFWEKCEELGYIDFCNIIYKSYILLRDNPEIVRSIGSKFASFLIDEFQDTTELQIEIFKLIFGKGKSKFFVVGDLSQSIYSFTGARPELVMPFADFIGAKTDTSLSGNFRSNPQIIAKAELLFPRVPPMTATGRNSTCNQMPEVSMGISAYAAITEIFLPKLMELGIPLGEATILARTWPALSNLSRQLRESGIPVIGPGARPYRRSRLFATLAEQICGALIDWQSDTIQKLERALFHTIEDLTGDRRLEVFSFKGRLVLMRLLREARRLREDNESGISWLDLMSMFVGRLLFEFGFVSNEQSGVFYASVQEMKVDMTRNRIDLANLTIGGLGLFASPSKSLRLSTIHFSKGREYDAVAIIDVKESSIPFYKATTVEAIEDEKRLFYVASTRARRVLLYIYQSDRFGNPPSRFLSTQGISLI